MLASLFGSLILLQNIFQKTYELFLYLLGRLDLYLFPILSNPRKKCAADFHLTGHSKMIGIKCPE
jgi:hypothetical protein